jgi:DNA helicase II / ATP-dependent DNA helicase PcrA
LHSDKSPEGLSRHENIQELLNGIQEFSINALEEGRPAKLENYLEDVALLTDQDSEKDEDRDKVTLMTVHSAKGLEFKNVFVVGLEENLFPSAQAEEKKTQEALEEERRLFYVALTRAKENAWFSYANQRYRWGNLEFCSPSRFLLEMDEKYLDGMVENGRMRPASRNLLPNKTFLPVIVRVRWAGNNRKNLCRNPGDRIFFKGMLNPGIWEQMKMKTLPATTRIKLCRE